MERGAGTPQPLRVRVERVLLRISEAIALVGGALLAVIAGVTVYSIVGRAIGDVPLLSWWSPVRGDFELVEMGTAIAICAFLPYTQLKRGNVLVDVVTSGASPRAKAGMAVVANALYAAMAILFTARMIAGGLDLYTATFTQTTMLLRIPVWWGYLPTSIFLVCLSGVALYSVWRSVDEALGRGEPAEP